MEVLVGWEKGRMMLVCIFPGREKSTTPVVDVCQREVWMSPVGKAQLCHLWCQELSLQSSGDDFDVLEVPVCVVKSECKVSFVDELDKAENCCKAKAKSPESTGKLT